MPEIDKISAVESKIASRKTFWDMVIVFEVVFILQSIIVLLKNSPSIFPDEVCALKRAIYFAQHFSFETCENITLLPSGDPYPFYSAIISPVYWFTYGLTAYKTILIFNALLISSLVFPLFKIFKRFIENNKTIFGGIFFILFLPQILVYGASTMTETVFIVINIWFLYFYLKSFDSSKPWLYKMISVLIAIFGAFSRPFGFIILLALIVNEIACNKNSHKKKFILLLVSLTIALVSFAVLVGNAGIIEATYKKILGLNSLDGWLNVGKAIAEQINSFSIATFIVPVVLFFSRIGEDDSKDLASIRVFLISYIGLNFLISAQHIYGYFMVASDPGILTRYIQSSLVYIFMFSFIFFFRYKTLRLNGRTIVFTSMLLASLLLFFPTNGFKHSLNFDSSIYGETYWHMYGKDIIPINFILEKIFLIFSSVLFVFLVLKKRVLFAVFLIAAIGINSFYIVTRFIPQMKVSPLSEFLGEKEEDVSYLLGGENEQQTIDYLTIIWELHGLTRNRIHTIVINFPNKDHPDPIIGKDEFKNSDFFKKSKYIISKYNLDLPIVIRWASGNLYRNDQYSNTNTQI